MRHSQWSESAYSAGLTIERFDALQERYRLLALEERARTMLEDATPALKAADEVLRSLSHSPKIPVIINKLRKNDAVIHKMRPSEARNMLMDPHIDFIDTCRRKLATWRTTLERLAGGEGIIHENELEYIPRHLPVALAYSCMSTTTHYLSIIQLLLMELEKRDSKKSDVYHFSMARIRRCSTVLSDCESASDIATHIH